MKKNLFVLAMSAGLLLSACGAPTPVASSLSSSDVASSEVSSVVAETNFDKVQAALNNLITTKVFQVVADNATVIYTENYIDVVGKTVDEKGEVTATKEAGYALLDSVYGGKAVYSYNVLGGEFIKGSYANANSLKNLNPVGNALLLSHQLFADVDNKAVTKNTAWVSAFKSSIPADSDEAVAKIAKIYFYQDGTKLMLGGLDENDAAIEGVREAVISNIGSARVELVEKAVADYKVPEVAMDESALASITGTKFHSTAKFVFEYKDSTKEAQAAGSFEYAMDEKAMSAVTKTAEGEVVSSEYLKADEDGTISKLGLTATNEVKETPTTYKWEKLAKPSAGFVANEWRQVGTAYEYYGYDAANLIYRLVGANLGTIAWNGATATLADGKIDTISFHSAFSRYKDSDGSIVIGRYAVKISIDQNPSAVAEFAPNPTQTNLDIVNAVNELTKPGANYRVVDSDSGAEFHSEWTVTENIFLRHIKDGATDDHGDGYVQDEAGLHSFTFNGDQVVVKDVYKNKTIQDIIPWKVSADVLALTHDEQGANYLTFKGNVDVNSFIQNIYADSYVQEEGVHIDKLSIEFKNNKISQVAYAYVDAGAIGEVTSTYTYGNAKVGSILTAAINAAIETPYQAPTSWNECLTGATLLKKTGLTEDEIGAIPYLSVKEYDQLWTGYANGGYSVNDNYVVIRVSSSSEAGAKAKADKEYLANYAALLLQNGWTMEEKEISDGWYGSETFNMYTYTGDDAELKEKLKYVGISLKTTKDVSDDGFRVWNFDPNDAGGSSSEGGYDDPWGGY